MAKIIDNPSGRRMIRLSSDDVFAVISVFQEKISSKIITTDEARKIFDYENIYLPEEV